MDTRRGRSKKFADEMLAHNQPVKKWLHRLTGPSLILWGDSDGKFPEAFAHAYHNLIPNTDLEISKDFGHVPTFESQEACMAKAAKA